MRALHWWLARQAVSAGQLNWAARGGDLSLQATCISRASPSLPSAIPPATAHPPMSRMVGSRRHSSCCQLTSLVYTMGTCLRVRGNR